MKRLIGLMVLLCLVLGVMSPVASAARRTESSYEEDFTKGGGGGAAVVSGIDKAKTWWGRVTFVRDVVLTIAVATATVVEYGRQAWDAGTNAVNAAGNYVSNAIDNRPVSGTIVAP